MITKVRDLQLTVFLLVMIALYSNGQDLASSQMKIDLCIGKSQTATCAATDTTKYTVNVDEALYGIKNPTATLCQYNLGDCYNDAASTFNCLSILNNCVFIASSLFNLANCPVQKPDYLHVRYKCIPYSSTSIPTYDMASMGDATTSNGFVQSPNFPSYSATNDEITKKIVAPTNKIINLWIVEIQLKNPDATSNCATDYVKISDNTGTYKFCGSKKVSLEGDLCSSQLFISYKATTTGTFKGFKIYYEFVDRSTQPDCPTDIISLPPPTTTPVSTVTTTLPSTLPILQATDIKTVHVCKGLTTTITGPPSNFYFFPLRVYYGVTPTLICDPPLPTHCTAPAQIFCAFTGNCPITFLTNNIINDCGGQVANYLAVEYRQLPIISSTNFSMCSGGDIDGSSSKYGIVTSPNYPKWLGNQNCAKRIVAPVGKVIRAHLTDIAMEDVTGGECSKSYIAFNENGKVDKFCGTRTSSGTYTYVSCNNTISLTYVSSDSTNMFYRGMNLYFEIIDKSSAVCQNEQTKPPTITTTTTTPTTPTTTTKGTGPTVTTTTTTTTTTTKPDVTDIFSSILTEGGNAVGAPCVFPFTYQGSQYSSCIPDDTDNTKYWCATTDNYDRDKVRGYCKLSITSVTSFDLCPGKTERFYCPKGFLIYVIAAEYRVTTDGSCSFNKTKCIGSALSSVRPCSDKANCSIIHLSTAVFDPPCTGDKSNLMHVDYACVPDSVAGLATTNMCTTQTITGNSGIIQASYGTNLNCVTSINAPANKLINIYSVQISLRNPSVTAGCETDKFTIDDGVSSFTKCGTVNADLLLQSCSTKVTFTLNTGSTSSVLYKGVKLFYEIVDKPSDFGCGVTTPPTTSATKTTTVVVPSYVTQGISSPLQTTTICKNNALDIILGPSIKCPNNYRIVVRKALYGTNDQSKCVYNPNDCTSSKANPTIENNCIGQQSCFILHASTSLPECGGAMSTYLYVEYECIPIALPTQNMCGATFTATSGIIKSPNYPNYDQLTSCIAKITTNVGYLVKAYIIDMAIDEKCDSNYLFFNDTLDLSTRSYCYQESFTFAIETCSAGLTIKLNTNAGADPSYKGVLIYYEIFPRPNNFVCPALIPQEATTLKPTITTTTTTTSGTTKTPYYGMASDLLDLTTCSGVKTISCPTEYVLVLLSTDYAASDSQSCTYSPFDCFEKTNILDACAGKTSCLIYYSNKELITCGRRRSSYLYITYQCVPTVSAGKPTPVASSDICGAATPVNVPAKGSILLNSPAYPKYPTTETSCKRDITTEQGYALKVYTVDAAFKGSGIGCNNSKDYLRVSDCIEDMYLCGNTNNIKLLLESVDNTVRVEYSGTGSTTQNALYKGFKIYVESVQSDGSCNFPTGPTTTSPPPPINGFATAVYHSEICALSEKTYDCHPDYYMVVLEEHYLYTGIGCNHTASECKQPTDIAYDKCAAQSTCAVYLPHVPLARCGNKNADLLDIEYQCVPASLPTLKTFTCGDEIRDPNGFILSPEYPNYATEINRCRITISKPEDQGIIIYLIDLSLSDPIENGSCPMDYLRISEDEHLCGTDKPKVIHINRRRRVEIDYRSLTEGQASANQQSLRGFKLYFETFPLFVNTTATTKTTTTTTMRGITVVNNDHLKRSKHLTGWSLGLGIPLMIAMIVGTLYLIRTKKLSSSQVMSSINYSKSNEEYRSFENPNFDINTNNLYDDKNLNLQN